MKGRITPSKALALSLALLGAAALAVGAQEEPLPAGEGGIPKPKRTKTVKPEYPAEAQAQGIRGIVILQVTVDTQGKVVSVDLVRSVAGLDEAAMAAARQWEYEVSKVDGKPVSVRFPEVITFALRLPEIDRQAGIPELRMGAAPAYPKDGRGRATVIAELTLDPSGQVAEAQIVEGASPFSEALLQALRTWRFAAERSDEVLSFRVEARFDQDGDARGRVGLSLSGLRRSEFLAPAPPGEGATAPAPVATPSPAPPAAEPTPAAEPPPASAPPVPASAPPASAAPQPAAVPPAGPSPTPPGHPTPDAIAAPAGGATPVTGAPSPPAPPAVEVITAPTRPPAPVPEVSGVSAIRDVTLEQNVPDLTRGRRPVPPPFARMGALSGKVEVLFSVDAAGQSRVKSASGPDVLRVAAEDTVSSWVFRRTTADRLHLVATIEYAGDVARATVKPQPEEAAPAPAPPGAAPSDSPVPAPTPEPRPSPAEERGERG